MGQSVTTVNIIKVKNHHNVQDAIRLKENHSGVNVNSMHVLKNMKLNTVDYVMNFHVTCSLTNMIPVMDHQVQSYVQDFSLIGQNMATRKQ